MLKYPFLINLVMGIVGKIELQKLNKATKSPRKNATNDAQDIQRYSLWT